VCREGVVSCARAYVSFGLAQDGDTAFGPDEPSVRLSAGRSTVVSVARAVSVSKARACRRWDEPMAYSKSNSIPRPALRAHKWRQWETR
jgi:hypothetical protein